MIRHTGGGGEQTDKDTHSSIVQSLSLALSHCALISSLTSIQSNTVNKGYDVEGDAFSAANPRDKPLSDLKFLGLSAWLLNERFFMLSAILAQSLVTLR